jgi:hypothetical protein
MYRIGQFMAVLWRHKEYTVITIAYFVLMTYLEKALHFDLSLSIFLMLAFLVWVIAAARTQKMRGDSFTERLTFRYIHFYIDNFKRFFGGVK